MKKGLAILVTLMMLIPALSQTLIYVWFKANQETLAANYCEKRNTSEEESCKGCCYLAKQLKQTEQQTTDNKTTLPGSRKIQDNAPEYFMSVRTEDAAILPFNTLIFSRVILPCSVRHTRQPVKPPASRLA